MRMPATNEIPPAAQVVAGVVDVRQHDCQIAVQIAAGGAQRCCADRPSARAAVMGWLIRPPTRPAKTVVLLSDPFPLSVIQDAGQCPSECMSSLMSLVIEISD